MVNVFAYGMLAAKDSRFESWRDRPFFPLSFLLQRISFWYSNIIFEIHLYKYVCKVKGTTTGKKYPNEGDFTA